MTVALDFPARLRAAYDRHFTRHKRQPTRAMSWPATWWLVRALDAWDAETVLECGSGWSTTALRMWEAERGGRYVTTTDHKVPWLDLAQRECLMEGLSAQRFVFHEDLPRALGFDVVLVDLADTPTRSAQVDRFVGWAKPGGMVVFDDWHVRSYRETVTAWLTAKGWDEPTPIPETTDEWGRYLATWRAP